MITWFTLRYYPLINNSFSLNVSFQDAKTVVKSVSNVVNDYEIPYELFDHLDFIFAKDVVDLLYVELIKTMQAY